MHVEKIQLIRKFEKTPLFSFNEFIRITGFTQEYARTYLHRLKQRKLLFQIERGKYSVFDDPLLFSSFIFVPSYISFWTAFRFYNFTEQLPQAVMVACPRPKRAISFKGRRIVFFKIKHMWGYAKKRYKGFEIFVADKEKCILDSLFLKNVPFDEIVKAVFSKDFDSDRLVEYALRIGKKSIMKRLGYLLDFIGIEAKPLLSNLDNNYVALDWSRPRKGKKDKKWKIILNRRLDDIW